MHYSKNLYNKLFMNKIAYFLLALILLPLTTSCFEDTNWEKYKEWRDVQDEWLNQELKKTNADGTPFYEPVVASFDKNMIVYMHYYGDRDANRDNLVPLYTSTVSVKYHGRYYNDEPFDSSYSRTDSIANFTVNGVITGWSVALLNMHVGDSVKVIIPYNAAYGESGYQTIPPYATLIFQMKLKDIVKYEAK